MLITVTDVTCEVKVEYSVTLKETKKLSEFHQISKLWDSPPLVVKVTAKYCVSFDFRPSTMEISTRHLALCNRVYLSGCSQFKQVGTRSNQLDLVPVHMV